VIICDEIKFEAIYCDLLVHFLDEIFIFNLLRPQRTLTMKKAFNLIKNTLELLVIIGLNKAFFLGNL
jgi:hypothetical protein